MKEVYISPEFKRQIKNLFFTLENPQYFSVDFPAKKRYLFFGQQKLQKEAQLQALIGPYTERFQIQELVIDVDQELTLKRIKNFQCGAEDIIFIRDIHYLAFALKNYTIQKFAQSLDKLPNTIIGVSDIPVDMSNPFYRQFEVFTVATTPTQSHLKNALQYYMLQFHKLLEDNNLEQIKLKLDDNDCLWLAQQSVHCTDMDVHEFMNRVYDRAIRHVCSENDSEFIIDRSYVENLDNGLMFAFDASGETVSITKRDATKDQNVFTAMSDMVGVSTRKRARED